MPGLSVVGRLTSSRFPPTSTTTVVRSSATPSTVDGVCGGTSLTHSVSIHRVCTPNGSLTYAGSRTTAQWKGSTVAIPSTTVSSSARRARSSASVRVSPYTITLASNESKLPPMTLPDSIPVSTRTPGPAGQRSPVTVPGAGRKPRPGSSPLIRNSIACPRGCGSAVKRNRSPAAIRNCSRTRSTPDVSSVTGCSTWSRVLTSRKDTVPSAPTRYSTVPAPWYPASRQIALALSWIRDRCPSVRNGAGASSTSFWCRRCNEQSRVPITTTLPYVSASTCASTCRGRSR